MIDILLADDHSIVREGVRRILGTRSDLRVLAEACDGAQAVELALRLRPDLAILDLSMPRLSGIEAIAAIRRQTATRCIAFSMHETHEHVKQALRAGAAAYVVKSGRSDELLEAIDAVWSGRSHLSPSVAHHALEPMHRPRNGAASRALTAREREVLRLVAAGLSSREIAAALGISQRTIDTHRANLMAKLNTRSGPGLVRVAFQEGWLRS